MWVQARGPRCETILEKGLAPRLPCPAKLVPDANTFELTLRRLIQLVKEGNPATHSLRAHLFEGLFLQMQRHDTEAESPDTPYDELIRRITDNPFQDWDFKAEARNSHVSYSHFRRRFREIVHHSPHDFLLSCRMQHVAQELRKRPHCIQQVAYELGYDNYYYFSRLFRQQIGLSPRDYVRGLPM